MTAFTLEDTDEAISLLEDAAIALWRLPQPLRRDTALARTIDTFLDRVSPASSDRIKSAISERPL